jgi:type VI protein secretion system component Hcp
VPATAATGPAAGLLTGETSGVVLIEMGSSTIGPLPIVGFDGGFNFERPLGVGGATAAGSGLSGAGPTAGTSVPNATVSSGASTRITAQPVTVEKVIDAESQRLLDLALKGQEVPTVRILFCRSSSACTASNAQTSYTLARARISEITYNEDAETPALTEQITFTYDQIKLATQGAQNGARSELCFDAAANRVCASS